MFALLRRIPKSRLALFGLFEESTDVVKTPGYEELSPKYRGMEAVRRMFLPDEYGELSKELVTCIHMSMSSIFIGVVYGAVSHGRKVWFDFVENNQASQFHNHMDAKRQLQNHVTVAMGKGGFKGGLKIGGFTTVFIFLKEIIGVHRGEPGIVEYVGAGMITGGIFKLNLGPKGFVAGSLVGAFLGLLGGAASISLLYMTGYTIDDIEQTQYLLHTSRNEAVRQAMKLHMYDESERAKILAATEEEKLHPDRSPLDQISKETKPVEAEAKVKE